MDKQIPVETGAAIQVAVTVEEAIELINEKANTGVENDISGEIFFGVTGTPYVWSDTAEEAGITDLNHRVAGADADNASFHHFRDEEEIRKCLLHIEKMEGFLIATLY